MICCGVVVGVTDVLDIGQKPLRSKRYAMPAIVPRTWDSYGVGYVRGKPKLICEKLSVTQLSVTQFIDYTISCNYGIPSNVPKTCDSYGLRYV